MGTIQIKRRLAGGTAAPPASLASGELAWNGPGQILHYGEGDNGSGVATSIIDIAGLGAFVGLAGIQTITGAKTFSVSPGVPTASPGTNTTAAASTAFVQAGLALKANLASPALTGTPTAPTASAGTNTTQLATCAFVQSAVSAIIDAAPGALDTLNELAAALGDDPNFAATITNNLALKANLASPALTGVPTAPTATTGTDTTQLATCAFVQQEIAAGSASIDGGTY